MKTPFQIQQERISKSIAFSAEDVFEKGGKSVPIGTIHVYSGTKYKKTIAGWIPIGKDKKTPLTDAQAKKDKQAAFDKKTLEEQALPGSQAYKKLTVDADEYRTKVDGGGWSAIIHPEDREAIESLKPGQEHKFTDEQDMDWRVTNAGDGYNLNGAERGNENYKGNFKFTKSESNEELVSKHGDQLLEKSEDGHWQVKTLDGTFMFNGHEMAEMYGGEWMEKGGAGSKGGKIIGHDKSGKPIYETSRKKQVKHTVRFKPMTIGGKAISTESVTVHAHGTDHAVKKAAKKLGIPESHHNGLETHSIKRHEKSENPEFEKGGPGSGRKKGISQHTDHDPGELTGDYFKWEASWMSKQSGFDRKKFDASIESKDDSYAQKWMSAADAAFKKVNKAEDYLDAQEDLIEKGKALPIGTIKKRGDNNFQKTANGWKYHSRANKGPHTTHNVRADEILAATKEINKLKEKRNAAKDIYKRDVLKAEIDKKQKTLDSLRGTKKKAMTFEEALADPAGRKMIDAIEEYIGDLKDDPGRTEHLEGLQDAIKSLKKKTGYQYHIDKDTYASMMPPSSPEPDMGTSEGRKVKEVQDMMAKEKAAQKAKGSNGAVDRVKNDFIKEEEQIAKDQGESGDESADLSRLKNAKSFGDLLEAQMELGFDLDHGIERIYEGLDSQKGLIDKVRNFLIEEEIAIEEDSEDTDHDHLKEMKSDYKGAKNFNDLSLTVENLTGEDSGGVASRLFEIIAQIEGGKGLQKSDIDELRKAKSQLDALDDILEKGKALPVGTIKKRGPNNFIKTPTGWKYHSRANKGGGAAGPTGGTGGGPKPTPTGGGKGPSPKKPSGKGKYKREEFESKKMKEGDTFLYPFSNKPGWVRAHKIKNGLVHIGEQSSWQDKEYSDSSRGITISTHKAQDIKNTADREKHDKAQDIKEMSHDINAAVGKVKGGALNTPGAARELGAALKKMTNAVEKFRKADTSIGAAGGWSGTMRSSQSGTPLTVRTNDVHRAGTYGFDRSFAIQVQIGGGLTLPQRQAMKESLKQLLGKFEYKTNLGSSHMSDTDGTNWDSVMIVAPSGDKHWSPLPDSVASVLKMQLR